MLSVGLGGLPMVVAGCVSDGQQTLSPEQAAAEREGFEIAMASPSPRETVDFLRSFPNSQYIPRLLASQSPRRLAGIPRGVIAGLPPQTLRRIDPAILAQFRVAPPGAMAQRPVARPDARGGGGGGGGFGGGGGGGGRY